MSGSPEPRPDAPHGIAEVARAVGVSSRTLRHYDAIGLLPATAVGDGGVRRYDDRALVRLQRILLLRGLGLRLDEVRRVLDGERDDVAALTEHLRWLEEERERLTRQMTTVRTTVRRLQEGTTMTTTGAFDGFDRTRFQQEVEDRWGADAWRRGQDWWGSRSDSDKRAFQDEQRAIAADAAALAASGAAAESDAGRALARRQLAWLAQATPAAELSEERIRSLAGMYIEDERFTQAYDGAGPGAARALSAAMIAYADGTLD